MAGGEIAARRFGYIVQVIGVAYTYQPSRAVRRHLTRDTRAYHSSQSEDFSYFYKGDGRSLVGHGEPLRLRQDPLTGETAGHWPEPELAVLLGERHRMLAFTLANDLTAVTVERCGRTAETDNTYLGKVWDGSGSLGPRFVAASDIGDPSRLVVGISIARDGVTVYDQSYNTSRSLFPLAEIPDRVVRRCREFGDSPPPSKRVEVGPGGFLPPGTVIMLGTGLIVQRRYFCRDKDRLTVHCPHIGELTNTVTLATRITDDG